MGVETIPGQLPFGPHGELTDAQKHDMHVTEADAKIVQHVLHFENHGYPYEYSGQPLNYNPYGFPLSSTGIPIVQQLRDVGTLGVHDVVGTSFWIATNAMLAFTLFFLVELKDVPVKWRRSVTCAALVTGVAFWNYTYMRDAWVYTQQSPTTYRYTDWLITVPIQIVEFYLILSAVQDVSIDLFWRLLIGSVVMLLSGWAGETGAVSVLVGFIPGMLGWLYILYEIFAGEASQISAKGKSKAAQSAFKTLSLIVSVGWAIYPLGYYLVYLGPTVTYHSESVVNIVYNIADLVNKGAFGMCIYSAAMSDE
jgi:bacteriorhodopsin